jgi:hypothetical protein
VESTEIQRQHMSILIDKFDGRYSDVRDKLQKVDLEDARTIAIAATNLRFKVWDGGNRAVQLHEMSWDTLNKEYIRLMISTHHILFKDEWVILFTKRIEELTNTLNKY